MHVMHGNVSVDSFVELILCSIISLCNMYNRVTFDFFFKTDFLCHESMNFCL